MSSTQILEDALQLLKTKGWTKTYMARAANGTPVYPESPAASCFCAIGAIRRVVQDSALPPTCDDVSQALDSLSSARSLEGLGKSMGKYNDELETPEQLHAWFELAIERSKTNG